MPDWYLQLDGEEHGPISEADFLELIRTSVVTPETKVRTSQSSPWSTASKVKGIRFASSSSEDKAEEVTPKVSAFRESRPPTTPNSITSERRCPFCAELINANAVKCKHCGEFLNIAPQKSKPVRTPKRKAPNKNVAALLAFFFGPLGMCYSTWRGALVVLIAYCCWAFLFAILVGIAELANMDFIRFVSSVWVLVGPLGGVIMQIVWASEACSDNPRWLGNHFY